MKVLGNTTLAGHLSFQKVWAVEVGRGIFSEGDLDARAAVFNVVGEVHDYNADIFSKQGMFLGEGNCQEAESCLFHGIRPEVTSLKCRPGQGRQQHRDFISCATCSEGRTRLVTTGPAECKPCPDMSRLGPLYSFF